MIYYQQILMFIQITTFLLITIKLQEGLILKNINIQ